VNVREWRRLWDRATRLPSRLVEETKQASSLGQHAWADARRAGEFSRFAPHLERLLALRREAAECWGYEACPYDALLEEYEPGARVAALVPLFDEWRRGLAEVLPAAVERSAGVPEHGIAADYPAAQQERFNREVAAALGFDFDAGRIDTSSHPFCAGIGPGDVRMTTRYDERDFTSSLYGVLHETGHGLYDQGLPAEHHGTPAGEAVSLGIHESQSRLWENHVGRAPAFWQHWYPVACEHLPALRAFTPEQVIAHVTRVAPSFIRVESDEVTYDLHILLRFELERRLVSGELKVPDLPAAWNARFRELLGREVPDDRRGCLQDIHWSGGGFGYFPTYTLGNLNAAQLMAAAQRDIPDLPHWLGCGTYAPLLNWLRARVHAPGSRLRPDELMRRATGGPTGTAARLAHLRARYAA
jgi:carboxypeptidase Taq